MIRCSSRCPAICDLAHPDAAHPRDDWRGEAGHAQPRFASAVVVHASNLPCLPGSHPPAGRPVDSPPRPDRLPVPICHLSEQKPWPPCTRRCLQRRHPSRGRHSSNSQLGAPGRTQHIIAVHGAIVVIATSISPLAPTSFGQAEHGFFSSTSRGDSPRCRGQRQHRCCHCQANHGPEYPARGVRPGVAQGLRPESPASAKRGLGNPAW